MECGITANISNSIFKMEMIKMKLDWTELPEMETVDEQENPVAVAHFTLPNVGDWYVLAGEIDKELDDILFFGLVKLYVKELGYFTLRELMANGILYDINWEPKGVYDIYPDFDLRK